MNRSDQPPNGDKSGDRGQQANGWGQPANHGEWGQPAGNAQPGQWGKSSINWNQPSNEWGTAPATDTFPPVHPGSPGPLNQPGPQRQPGQPAPKKPRTGAVIGVIIGILFVLAVAAAVLVWALGWFDRSGSSTQSTVVEVVTETAGVPGPGERDNPGAGLGEPQPPVGEDEPGAESRPADPALPAAAAPANSAAINGRSAGNFDNAYTGSSVTSAPFASAVAAAYRAHVESTGETNGVVEAFSPVTGDTYTMNCRDNGSYVTCTGGNNAVVYIS